MTIMGNDYLRESQRFSYIFLQRFSYVLIVLVTLGERFFWGFGATTTMAIKTQKNLHNVLFLTKVIHVFSLVCFLIYGVKRRSGHVQIPIYGVKRRSEHDGSQSFGPIWHVSGPEMVF